ncbi:hypothetical protein HAZT_HAZT001889 [Hyalella azteca]|uniref:Neurotransmitter-gated ion-channel transmembrane domain-containing protein n=1 Tax=Hyalella azteca TaxID=294128 RepID=A0A6A0HFR0_HYAAZ|nr:hypothetical protein HAZT_HAZT001889 [Hyalella azteca]
MCAGNFTCLEVVFTLKRRLGYYLFHTYMPTCLIVIMSWISFWIKPEAAPARVTLGVTSLLTLSTQHAKSQASLPPVSYIKIIDMFMNSCTMWENSRIMCVAKQLRLSHSSSPVLNYSATTRSSPEPAEHNSVRDDLPTSSVERDIGTMPTSPTHTRSLSVGPYSRNTSRQKAREAIDETAVRKTSLHTDFFRSHRDKGYHADLDRDVDDGPDSYLNVDCRVAQGRDSLARGKGPREYKVPPPPPPPQKSQPAPVIKAGSSRRAKAIVIDRFSRLAFPLSFLLVNLIYWISMWSHI